MAESLHAAVETILELLLIVFAVTLIAQWVRLPYTIALVVTGLLGFQPNFRDLQLTPDLILVVFLPVLLFEGAYNVSARSLRRDLLQLMAFGVVGISLLLQGLTMPLLIRKLGLVSTPTSSDELPILRAQLHAVGDALLALSHEHDQGNIGALPYERLAQSYRREQTQLQQQLNDLESSRVESI